MNRTGKGSDQESKPQAVGWLALLCGLGIIGIFGGYEVVERLWLRDANSDLLRVLHLVRGLGTSMLVGLVVGWFLLRWAPRIFPSQEIAPRLTSPASHIEATLRQNARWFITMRWAVVIVTLLATLLGVRYFDLLPTDVLAPLLGTIAGLALSNLAFSLALRRVRRLDRFLILQVGLDLVFLTGLLHFSGGIENPFSRVFIFHIVIAAILFQARTAYAIVAWASLLLAAMAVAEATGLLPHYPIALFPYSAQAGARDYAAVYMPFVLGKVTSCLLVFWVTAYFAVLLREQLQLRDLDLLRSAEKLGSSEQRLTAVVNSMGAALLLWSNDHRLIWCNQLARQWFKFPDGEGAQPDACPLFPHATNTRAACRECATARALRSGESVAIETPHPLPDGRGRILRIQAIPLQMDSGKSPQVLELVHDVTDQKAMEAEVLHATKMAALGRMATALAHEIGNPIASMVTRLQLMEEEEGGAVFARESAQLLREQIERIRRLVHSVTRFAAPAPSSSICNPGDVLVQIISMIRMDPRARDVLIELQSPDVLPWVKASTDQLSQVFLNVALNGLEAMPGGGRLGIRVQASANKVRVEFADSGCGLSEEAKTNLFRPFFTTKKGGTGLGLFLSHKIVCELGGAMRGDGQPGQGSRFEIVLPATAHLS
ncbi:MAG: PAS domain-containing protein [Acidobacteria bacterium]|nr:PAS domain-containing protein [Acidobacteriota bacterium]